MPSGAEQALKFSSVRYGSSPDLVAFPRSLFIVCTEGSTLPFALGCNGLEVVCLNSHCLAKSRYSLLVNWGPLSVMTVFGIPCLAKIDLVCAIIAELVVSVSKLTTG